VQRLLLPDHWLFQFFLRFENGLSDLFLYLLFLRRGLFLIGSEFLGFSFASLAFPLFALYRRIFLPGFNNLGALFVGAVFFEIHEAVRIVAFMIILIENILFILMSAEHILLFFFDFVAQIDRLVHNPNNIFIVLML
jgi:hypothetical protein